MMQSHARLVVIGGGIAGCSLLYHLAKLGWRGLVLLERNELTAGSTWHAAGNTPHFETSLNMSRIQKYSTELYRRLESETGQPTGFHKCGSIRLAQDRDRLDQFRHLEGQAKAIGLAFEVIGPNEIRSLHPLTELDGVIAGAWTPEDGYTDPSSTTQALARGARDLGAAVHRRTKVTALSQKTDGHWIVATDRGVIESEIVVNAAGTWAREVGAMAGLDLPIVSMEHQYLVTEPIAEVEALGRELPLLRDPDASFYMRQEVMGLLLGPYESDARPWAVHGVPPEFAQDLLPPDLERLEPFIARAMERVPVLRKAGIRRNVNGPIPHTPDGHPLIGPAPGQRNHFLLCGFSVGIAQGGGSGKALAEWIDAGEPPMEMFEFDPRRFGPWATLDHAVARAIETYAMMYAVGFPREERPGGRPSKTTPIYERLKSAGAVFEARYGWERAAWFAPRGTKAADVPSFRRSNWFEPVGAECRAVRERVGLLDLSGFAKFAVSGPGAEEFLDRICANRPPRRMGGIVLSQFLTPRGRILGEATVTRLGSERFYLVAAALAEQHHKDWLAQYVPPGGGVAIEDRSLSHGTLVLAGPRARDVLGAVTGAGLSSGEFPWLTAREILVAGRPVLAMRINYVGELGWELHHRFEDQPALYDTLMEAGAAHGIANFGTRAMDSLRLEKGYRAWLSDINVEVDPVEAGLDRLVRLDSRSFIGRDAVAASRGREPRWRCVLMTVEAGDADALPNAPICEGERVVGIVSSGGYGYTVGKSLALGYVETALGAEGTPLSIDILGVQRAATVVPTPLYDPENARLRT